jgi:hypothetical protein
LRRPINRPGPGNIEYFVGARAGADVRHCLLGALLRWARRRGAADVGHVLGQRPVVRSTRVGVARSGFAGFRFPAEVITVAVRWYLRFSLSYRDVEELLAERGVVVDHTTVYRWVRRFTPLFIEAARPCRHRPGDRWWVDETYVKVDGA